MATQIGGALLACSGFEKYWLGILFWVPQQRVLPRRGFCDDEAIEHFSASDDPCERFTASLLGLSLCILLQSSKGLSDSPWP